MPRTHALLRQHLNPGSRPRAGPDHLQCFESELTAPPRNLVSGSVAPSRRRSLSSTKSLSPQISEEEEDSDLASRLGMCNREIVRRGALILFCDYVVSAATRGWLGPGDHPSRLSRRRPTAPWPGEAQTSGSASLSCRMGDQAWPLGPVQLSFGVRTQSGALSCAALGGRAQGEPWVRGSGANEAGVGEGRSGGIFLRLWRY